MVGILIDSHINGIPEYNGSDVKQLLTKEHIRFKQLTLSHLGALRFPEYSHFILPYANGNFSKAELESILRFHECGGSILILGDIPFHDTWYPLRNSHAFAFHLTYGHDTFHVGAQSTRILTDAGRRILGNLPDSEYLSNRSFAGLRIKVFPPDRAYPLLKNFHEADDPLSHSTICIERKCGRFLGAKMAVVGFNGGEPRENVDGAFMMEWSYDPGLLNRAWAGIDHVVAKLLEWLEPAHVSGAIRHTPVSVDGDSVETRFTLRNMGSDSLSLKNVALCAGKDEEKRLIEVQDIVLEPNEVYESDSRSDTSTFGVRYLSLFADISGIRVLLDKVTERTVLKDASDLSGYGFATYWAFKHGKVTDEYRHFCLEMRKRGCEYHRANIPWEDIEPKPGEYVWDATDGMLEFARDEGIGLMFWMFPTTRGSGLGDGGIPKWLLREPAVDRNGRNGNFPSLWSPFYRKRYFALLEEFTRRYAEAPALSRFVLDFGNSDFPYGYHYYYNDPSLFDYSVWEKEAFVAFLKQERHMDLPSVSSLFGRNFGTWEEVPVPFVEESDPYTVYLSYRSWALREGIRKAWSICKENAPSKTPEDLPGHGLGSISDLTSAALESKARHWGEEKKFYSGYTDMHNAGPRWGGEPWQVGGCYEQYDHHLHSSLRHNAAYLTIPGADIGTDGEEVARIGFVRRTIMGAVREIPKIAVLDSLDWKHSQSLAHIGHRMDQEVDIISQRHRYDFSCYDLLVLPSQNFPQHTITGGGYSTILPDDTSWFWLLRESVEKGLSLLIFPESDPHYISGNKASFLKNVFGINSLSWRERKNRELRFPEFFGGGSGHGIASMVEGDGERVLQDAHGHALLLKQEFGKGNLFFAGYDSQEDSFDGKIDLDRTEYISDHTLVRFCEYLGNPPRELNSNQLFISKSLVRRGARTFLLVFNNLNKRIKASIEINHGGALKGCYELSTDTTILRPDIGSRILNITMEKKQGKYFMLTGEQS